LLIGLSEQFGLALAPNYATFFVFMLMVLVLAIRPQGLMGRA
jgi:branched-chain amino acid transport system permease protein